MSRTKHIINVHTGTGTTAPNNADLFLGEIAVQHTPNDPGLWIKVGTGETSTEYEKFIGETAISGLVETSLTGVTVNGSAATVSGRVAEIQTSIIYAGAGQPDQSLGNNGDVYLQADVEVVYETDGTTGLLGHNDSTLSGNWQLQNLDLTPYKYIKCYFAASTGTTDTATTPAVVVTIPLDEAAMTGDAYLGSVMVPLPFNRNREYLVGCAVDSTKTKFQVIHQNTLWDITTSDANDNGRYCYKIEGYI